MTRRMRIDDLLALTVPSQPAISPDGARIAYVLQRQRRRRPIRRQLALAGGCLGHAPRRADPRHDRPQPGVLARRRDARVPARRPAVDPAALGRRARAAHHLPLGAGAAVWSPDGTRIAFTAPVDGDAAADETDADRTARAGAPIVIDGVGYQADGSGFLRGMRMQLHVLDLASGEIRQLSEGAEHASAPAGRPTARDRLHREAHGRRRPDDARRRARARPHRPEGASASSSRSARASPERSPTRPMAIRSRRRRLAGRAHRASRGLFAVDLGTGATTELAATLDRNVMPGAPAYPGALPQFTADGRRAVRHPRPRLHPPVRGRARRAASPAWCTAATATSSAVSRSRADPPRSPSRRPTSFGEIVRVDLASGDETVVTTHGDTLAERRAVRARVARVHDHRRRDGAGLAASATPRSRARPRCSSTSTADRTTRGTAPPTRCTSTTRSSPPAGGPCSSSTRAAATATASEFYNAVFGAWGEADAKDFLEPIDDLVAEGLVDPKRLAITGYSYGGFMTCYLTSRDDRFAAAVAGGVVTDLISMGGTSDDAHFMNVVRDRRACRGSRGIASASPRCRRTRRSSRSRRRRSCCTAATTCAARSARPSSGTTRCVSAAFRRGSCSTPAPATCSR